MDRPQGASGAARAHEKGWRGHGDGTGTGTVDDFSCRFCFAPVCAVYNYVGVVRLGFLLLLCGGVLAEDAVDLKRRAYRALALGRVDEGRRLLERFVKEHPAHRDCAEVALAVAVTHSLDDEDIGLRVEWLRYVIKTWPTGAPAAHARHLLESAIWEQDRRAPKGSTLPDNARPGGPVLAKRKGGGTSTFRIFRLRPEPMLRTLLRLRFTDLKRGVLLRDEFKALRVPVATVKVEFHNGDSNRIKYDFKTPGAYILEERTSYGRSESHVLKIEPPNIYVKTLGRQAVGYTRVPARLYLRAKGGTREMNVDGLFEVALDATTWAFFRHGTSVDAFRLEPSPYEPHARVHIATDRPIYRPGQTVHFRAIRREWNRDGLKLPKREDVHVDIRDPKGRVLSRRTLAWDDQGALSGSFTLGPEPPLGAYSVVVDVPRPENERELSWEEGESPRHWFQLFLVRAYRKPDMKVRVEFPHGAKPVDGKIKARIVAQYFFGGPVADAEVGWHAEQGSDSGDDRYGPAPPLNGRDDWFRHLYDEVDESESWDEMTVAEGDGRTNADGVLEFEFAPKKMPSWNRPRFTIRAHVTDKTNRFTTGEGTVKSGQAGVRVRVGADRFWFRVGDTAIARVRVIDEAGRPVANHPVDLTAFVDSWEDEDEDWESFFQKQLTTDATGSATVAVPVKEGGMMRLRARTRDRAGKLAVARSESHVLHPKATREGVWVYPERLTYLPGETVRLMLLGEPGSRALFSIESDRFHDVRLIEFGKSAAQVIELKARRDWTPAVIAKLVDLTGDAPDSWGCEFFVIPADRILDVKVRPDRESYGPGDKARVSIDTGTAAQVELAVVDEAVYELAPDRTPHPLSFFWPLRPNDGDVTGSYFRSDNWMSFRFGSGVDEDSEVPLFGGQAEETEDVLAFSAGAAAKVRRRFAETAFWSGNVRTDTTGKAEIEIDVPDTLTRWRIVARAVAGADRFGAGRSEMLTRKAVVARIAAPRFLIEGDTCTVGVVVRNGLDRAQPFTVGLKGFGGTQGTNIAAGGQHRFDFVVRARRVGPLILHATATSKVESDAVAHKVPVLSRRVEIREARSAKVDGKWTQVFQAPVGARLELIVSGSRASAIREVLPYLAGYPYGCVEQTMSRFLPAVVAAGALERAGSKNDRLAKELPHMVANGLQRLYDFQHDEDGGWGWWRNDETNGWMTAYVVFGLVTAKRAGFLVDPKTLERGREALREMDATPFNAYVRSLAGDKVEWPAVKSLEDRAYLVLAGRRDIPLDVKLGDNGGPDIVRRVALVMRALAASNPKDPQIDRLVDWLLGQRRGAAWYSTLDSAYAVLALSALPPEGKAQPVEATLNGWRLRLVDGRATVGFHGRGELVVNGSAHVSAVVRYQGEPVAKASPDFSVSRVFERLVGKKWVAIKPNETVRIGDSMRMVATVDVKTDIKYVMLTVPLPAGMEALNPDENDDPWWGDLAVRDDRVEVAIVEAWKGDKLSLRIPVYALVAGTFRVRGPHAFAMYHPDREARGATTTMTIR